MGAVFAAANNTLTVKCVDDAGKALAGAKVQILALGTGGKWQDKKADNNGSARYDKLDDGVYRIVVRPDGYTPGLYEVVPMQNGAQESITVKCSPGDPLKKFYFEDDAIYQKYVDALKQGLAAYSNQKFDEAEQLFRSSLESNPTNPDAYFYLGVTLAQSKKWDQAQESLQKAQTLATAMALMPTPKDAKGQPQPSPYLTLKNNATNMLALLPGLKLKVEGNDEIVKKNYKQAITKLEEASKLLANDPDTFYYLALAQGYDKQWDAASKSVDKALALRPDDDAFKKLKSGLVNNAALEKAKEVADQGDTAYNTKDYATALKKYEEALPLLPDQTLQASVWVQIGRARTQLKQYDAAVEAYNRAAQLAPQDAAKYKQALTEHYKFVAQQYINEKQYDQAFAAYIQSGTSILEQGKKWEGSPDTENLAILAFQWLIKNDPQNVEAYFELGSVYYFKKDYAKAKENLNKYVEVGGKDHLQQAKDILTTIQTLEKKK